MIDRKPAAGEVILFRPDAPTHAARGWHGMTLRLLQHYKPADYGPWIAADPAGNARIVDVAPWSPAAKAGIMTGDLVVSIGDEPLDLWDEHGAPAETCVRVVAYRSVAGHYTADVVLVPRPVRHPPPQRQPRPASFPRVAVGRHVGPRERLQWQAAMFTDRCLNALAREVATYLATVRANNANLAYPSRATIARELDVSVRTIDRALARLRRRGWLKVLSGRRTGESNRYWLTWPAGY